MSSAAIRRERATGADFQLSQVQNRVELWPHFSNLNYNAFSGRKRTKKNTKIRF